MKILFATSLLILSFNVMATEPPQYPLDELMAEQVRRQTCKDIFLQAASGEAYDAQRYLFLNCDKYIDR